MAALPLSLWISFCGAMAVMSLSAEPMTAKTFADYAASPDLNDDQIYMVESMIDSARSEFDESYWDDFSEKIDERRKPGYKPAFKQEHVAPSLRILEQRDWLSLQRVNGQRPVRDIGALRFFPKVSGLSLGENEITDISPLAGFGELRRLHLKENRIRDLSPLAGCPKLDELEIGDNPVEDLSVLAKLPSLRQLTISADQLPVLAKVGTIPEVRQLHIWFIDAKPLESLRDLPLMPKLTSLSGISTKSLAGLERFPSLRNLNVDGEFDSLEPMASLSALTHVHMTSSKVSDLKPLGGLAALKSVWLGTDSPELGLEPLKGIRGLRDITIKCAGKEPPALKPFQKILGSWDEDFHVENPRHIPSQKLQVLGEKAFAALDHKAPHGTLDPDGNADLLGSEVDWLDEKLEAAFGKWLKEDEDYSFPRWQRECRWRDLELMSDKTLKALPRVVADIQQVLSHSKNDWIIYLQAAEGELNLWIYPDKVVVSKEHAVIAKNLLMRK
jgi:hypothetical protein